MNGGMNIISRGEEAEEYSGVGEGWVAEVGKLGEFGGSVNPMNGWTPPHSHLLLPEAWTMLLWVG